MKTSPDCSFFKQLSASFLNAFLNKKLLSLKYVLIDIIFYIMLPTTVQKGRGLSIKILVSQTIGGRNGMSYIDTHHSKLKNPILSIPCFTSNFHHLDVVCRTGKHCGSVLHYTKLSFGYHHSHHPRLINISPLTDRHG